MVKMTRSFGQITNCLIDSFGINRNFLNMIFVKSGIDYACFLSLGCAAKISPFIVTAKMTVALSGNSRAIEKKNIDKERISFYSNRLRHRSSMVFPSARSLLYYSYLHGNLPLLADFL